MIVLHNTNVVEITHDDMKRDHISAISAIGLFSIQRISDGTKLLILDRSSTGVEYVPSHSAEKTICEDISTTTIKGQM
jgi:hypothetical protein